MNTKTETQPKAKTAQERARFADLNSRAVTDQAKTLIDMLVSVVEDHQKFAGTRANQRGQKTRDGLRTAVEGFLGDLLLATTNEDAEGWCYRSTKAEGFSGGRVSYRNFMAVLKALQPLGYVEQLKGRQRGVISPFNGKFYASNSGVSSRFRATAALLKLADQEGLQLGDIEHHFIRQLPSKPLQLMSGSRKVKGKKVKGKKIKFPHMEKAQALEEEVKRINEFLDGFDIRGGIHKGYRRIFNEGDHKDFDWNRGGRLYGVDESYQRQPKDERLKMTIDGSPVVEIDITASYLTMLHGLSGAPFDPTQDPYAIEGIERRIVKAWTTATLGNEGHLKRWPPRTVENYREKTGQHLPSIVSTSQVRAAMEEKHQVLRNWETSSINWAVLMYHESKAMVATMVELMDLGIPSLAVHDSLIVRASDQEQASSVLIHKYAEVAGLTPEVKVSVSGAAEADEDLELEAA